MRTGIATDRTMDDRHFFAAMALAALAVVIAGFATRYYLQPFTRVAHAPAEEVISGGFPAVVHVHAVVFSGWIVLFAAQSMLVALRRVALHRRVGRLTAWLVPPMVVTGVLTAIRGGRDGWNPGGPYPDALGFMVVGLMDLVVFTSLTAAGLASYRSPPRHKRLMLLGTVGGLLWPAITRVPLLAGRVPLMFGVLIILVLAPALHDFLRGFRTRWLSLALGLVVLATFPLRTLVGNSVWWRAFAAWLIQ